MASTQYRTGCTFAYLVFLCFSICDSASPLGRESIHHVDNITSHVDKSDLPCHIQATDKYLLVKITQMLRQKVQLINYHLYFVNYSINPLSVNNTWSYKADRWARVSSQHGQALLSLAFNYGILSMMTLTFGVESIDVELEDVPYGCVMEMTERDKIDSVMTLLIHDFRNVSDTKTKEIIYKDGPDKDVKDYHGTISQQRHVTSLIGDERICHEIIKNVSGYAKFSDRCCHMDSITGKQTCSTEQVTSIWLTTVYALLAVLKLSILLFGPLLFIPMIETIAQENVPYVVKLKEPLRKKILLVKADTQISKYLMNFRFLSKRMIRQNRIPKDKNSLHHMCHLWTISSFNIPFLLARPKIF